MISCLVELAVSFGGLRCVLHEPVCKRYQMRQPQEQLIKLQIMISRLFLYGTTKRYATNIEDCSMAEHSDMYALTFGYRKPITCVWEGSGACIFMYNQRVCTVSVHINIRWNDMSLSCHIA